MRIDSASRRSMKTDVEIAAELNKIFGESDGREGDATERDGEAPTAISDSRQTDTDQRELATLRESNSKEDAGRTSGETESRVSQPGADPNSKRKTGTRRRWVM